MADSSDVRVALRIPKWLKKELNEAAAKSGWNFSSQVRYELMALRGKEPAPYLPSRKGHRNQA